MKKSLSEATPAPRRPRGRPRSFDRDAALDAAMKVFWEKGFEAASVADLTAAMGVNPPSLYAAFGDKEQLLLEAVERYQETRRESCPYADEPTARAAIERLLTFLAEQLCCPDNPRGCLMVMAGATTHSSPRLAALLAEGRAASRARMKARIERGIRDGDVPEGADAGALADFYSTLMTGMALQARDGCTRKSLMATVARAMQVFPEAPRKPAGRKVRQRQVA